VTKPIGASAEAPVNYVLRKSAKPLFISYAHADNEGPNERDRWLNRLIQFLAPLVSEGLSLCSGQTLGIGDNWHDRIQKDLDEAKAAIILISPAFLESEYIRNSELPIILKNAADRGVKIFPIIIKPCLFGRAKYRYPDPKMGPNEFSIASLQAANPPSRTLIEMTEGEQYRVFESVAEEIAKLLDR
jgi:hypothetical protein